MNPHIESCSCPECLLRALCDRQNRTVAILVAERDATVDRAERAERERDEAIGLVAAMCDLPSAEALADMRARIGADTWRLAASFLRAESVWGPERRRAMAEEFDRRAECARKGEK